MEKDNKLAVFDVFGGLTTVLSLIRTDMLCVTSFNKNVGNSTSNLYICNDFEEDVRRFENSLIKYGKKYKLTRYPFNTDNQI